MARCTYCRHTWTAKEVRNLIFSKDGKDCSSFENRQYFLIKHQGYLLSIGYLNEFLTFLLVITFTWYKRLSQTKEQTFFNANTTPS